MANNRRQIGATISLGGEADFRRAVQACNTSLRTMRSEMNLVTEQYRGQANSMDALRARHSVLERTLEQNTTLQSELERALEGSQRNYREAGVQLDNYRSQLARATEALADLEQQQSESADDSIAQQIQAQREEMDRLTGIVQRGERAYAQASTNVDNWQRQMNEARAEAVRLQRSIDETNGYIDEASHSADHCATSIDEMGRRITNTAEDTSDSVEELTDNVTSFFTSERITEYADAVSDAFAQVAQAAYDALQDLDEGYDTILTKTGASGDALAGFTSIADKIYGDLPATMGEIGVAVGEVNTRFGSTGDELEELSRKFLKFSNINGTDVNGSIDGVQSAMSAFNTEAKDAGKVLDVMNKAGQNTGISMDALQSALLQNAAAFRDMGMDIYTSIDFVSKLEKSGIDTASVMAGLKKAYQTSAREGKSFQESLAEVQDALANAENSTTANRKAVELFGKSYGSISTAVRDGRLNFTDLADSMSLLEDATNSVDDTFDDSLDTWDTMGVALNNLKTIGGRMMSDIMDIAAPAVELLADGLEIVREGLDALPSPLRRTVSTVTLVGGAVGIAGPKLLAFANTIRTIARANGVESLSGLASTISGVGEASAGAAATTGTLATRVRGAVTTMGPYVAIIAGACMVLKGLKEVNESYVEDLKEQDKTLGLVLENASLYTKKLTEVKEAMSSAVSDADKSVAEAMAKKDLAKPLVDSLTKLQGQAKKTDVDIAVMKRTVSDLNSLYPDLNLSVDESTGSLKANGQAVNDLTRYMDAYGLKIEQVAKKKALEELYAKKVNAEVEFEVSKMNRQELEKKMDAELEKAGLTFDEFRNMNKLQKIGLNLNPFDGLKNTAGLEEMVSEWSDLVDAQNELNDSYKQTEDKIKVLTGELDKNSDALNKATAETDANAESWTGAGLEVDRAAQKYVDLGVMIKNANGDISSVALSLADEEGALKELFESTCVLWQESHNQIMDGLGNEVVSLSNSVNKWQEYRDQVSDSVNSVSSIFKLREADEKKSWQAMRDGLVSNANAYELWNANVNAVLESARYQTDEAFREIANRIMLSGIDSADYLDSFVQHVDLTTTQAKNDIYEFTDLSGETERYASQMANLKTATEESMSGIAGVFDATKSAAQQSLEELSASLTEKSEEYTSYSENAKNLVESERYKTDEGFRVMVNTMLQQGMAGAGVISELWTAMQEGNDAVDVLLGSFQNFETAMSGFADVTASTEVALQGGMDGMVSIVSNAGEAFKIAMINDEVLMASGLTGEHMMSAVDSAIDKSIAQMTSNDTNQAFYDAGKANREAYEAGFAGGPLVHQYDGTGPIASLLHPMEHRNSVTNNMNLTVQQDNDGNFIQDVTRWMKKLFK